MIFLIAKKFSNSQLQKKEWIKPLEATENTTTIHFF